MDISKLIDKESYAKKYPNSKRIYEDAIRYIPAGVNSTARMVKSGWDPFPLSVQRGVGSRITDADGNDYIDYLLGLGPDILGHRNPYVTEAVTKHINEVGTVFALASELDGQVAKKMTECVDSLDKVRLSNSGTEAVIYALRLARAFTGKNKVIRFEGMYHGFSDSIYWNKHPSEKAFADNGRGIPEPQGPGLPNGLEQNLIICQWNDLDMLEEIIVEQHDEIAAVITEPIMCNTGCVLPEPGYLEGVRRLTEEYGVLLIMDEVITGFRVALGGAQSLYGIKPDLSVFAKGMGGGFPVAALGGRADIMQLIDDGIVSVAGTYSGNGIALAATNATLDYMREPGRFESFNEKAIRLMNGLDKIFRLSKLDAYVVGVGPLFQVWFAKEKIRNYRDAERYADGEMFTLWWREMLDRGILFHPHYYENMFISMAHTDADIDETLEKAEDAVKSMEQKLGL